MKRQKNPRQFSCMLLAPLFVFASARKLRAYRRTLLQPEEKFFCRIHAGRTNIPARLNPAPWDLRRGDFLTATLQHAVKNVDECS